MASAIESEINEWQIFSNEFVDIPKLANKVNEMIEENPEIDYYDLGHDTMKLLLNWMSPEKVFKFKNKEYYDFGQSLYEAWIDHEEEEADEKEEEEEDVVLQITKKIIKKQKMSDETILQFGIREEIDNWQIFNPEYVNTAKLADRVIKMLRTHEPGTQNPEIHDYDLGYGMMKLLLDFYEPEKIFKFKNYSEFGRSLKDAYEHGLEFIKEEQQEVKKQTLKEFSRIPKIPEMHFPGGKEYLTTMNKYKIQKICENLQNNNDLEELKDIADNLGIDYVASGTKKDLCTLLKKYYSENYALIRLYSIFRLTTTF